MQYLITRCSKRDKTFTESDSNTQRAPAVALPYHRR